MYITKSIIKKLKTSHKAQEDICIKESVTTIQKTKNILYMVKKTA